jgi:cbb3-type cytochrome oxidase cytochrome c subunit
LGLTATRKTAVALIGAGLTLYGSLFVTMALAGPQSSAKAPPKKSTTKTSKSNTAAITAGRKVYDANACAGCHSINGKGGSTGPDLTRVAADPKHTAKWLEQQVKNPKVNTPESMMPPYGDKIKGKDLTNLVAFLSSLKK